ncbi:hypothetical protein QOT17_009230 [Balamuthia mandrillaris]
MSEGKKERRKHHASRKDKDRNKVGGEKKKEKDKETLRGNESSASGSAPGYEEAVQQGKEKSHEKRKTLQRVLSLGSLDVHAALSPSPRSSNNNEKTETTPLPHSISTDSPRSEGRRRGRTTGQLDDASKLPHLQQPQQQRDRTNSLSNSSTGLRTILPSSSVLSSSPSSSASASSNASASASTSTLSSLATSSTTPRRPKTARVASNENNNDTPRDEAKTKKSKKRAKDTSSIPSSSLSSFSASTSSSPSSMVSPSSLSVLPSTTTPASSAPTSILAHSEGGWSLPKGLLGSFRKSSNPLSVSDSAAPPLSPSASPVSSPATARRQNAFLKGIAANRLQQLQSSESGSGENKEGGGGAAAGGAGGGIGSPVPQKRSSTLTLGDARSRCSFTKNLPANNNKEKEKVEEKKEAVGATAAASPPANEPSSCSSPGQQGVVEAVVVGGKKEASALVDARAEAKQKDRVTLERSEEASETSPTKRVLEAKEGANKKDEQHQRKKKDATAVVHGIDWAEGLPTGFLVRLAMELVESSRKWEQSSVNSLNKLTGGVEHVLKLEMVCRGWHRRMTCKEALDTVWSTLYHLRWPSLKQKTLQRSSWRESYVQRHVYTLQRGITLFNDANPSQGLHYLTEEGHCGANALAISRFLACIEDDLVPAALSTLLALPENDAVRMLYAQATTNRASPKRRPMKLRITFEGSGAGGGSGACGDTLESPKSARPYRANSSSFSDAPTNTTSSDEQQRLAASRKPSIGGGVTDNVGGFFGRSSSFSKEEAERLEELGSVALVGQVPSRWWNVPVEERKDYGTLLPSLVLRILLYLLPPLSSSSPASVAALMPSATADVLTASLVCFNWYVATEDEELWKAIYGRWFWSWDWDVPPPKKRPNLSLSSSSSSSSTKFASTARRATTSVAVMLEENNPFTKKEREEGVGGGGDKDGAENSPMVKKRRQVVSMAFRSLSAPEANKRTANSEAKLKAESKKHNRLNGENAVVQRSSWKRFHFGDVFRNPHQSFYKMLKGERKDGFMNWTKPSPSPSSSETSSFAGTATSFQTSSLASLMERQAFPACSPPKKLFKHSACTIGPLVWIFGGNLSNGLLVFDTRTSTWHRPLTSSASSSASLSTSKDDLPAAYEAHSCCVYKGRYLVFFGGGQGPFYSDELSIFDTVGLKWSKPEQTGDLPGARRAHAATIAPTSDGSCMLIFGGSNSNGPLASTYALHLASLRWKRVPGLSEVHTYTHQQASSSSLWEPRGFLTATTIGKYVLLYGGTTQERAYADVKVLNCDTMKWEKSKELATSPFPGRFGHSATKIGSWLFVFGGCTGQTYINELSLLNLETMLWYKTQPTGMLPPALAFHSASLVGAKLFLFGGYTGEEHIRGEEVHVLELAHFDQILFNHEKTRQRTVLVKPIQI